MMVTLFQKNLDEHADMISKLASLEEHVTKAEDVITESLSRGGKVMLCGNGGSAADAQHLAAEFTGRFIKDRRPIAALALTTDTSALTCISNDYSYKNVFSRQLEALGRETDVLIGISTSGNSENVLDAVKCAAKLGIKTIGLLGNNGGLLATECDFSIVVPSQVTARIQEAHILIGHTICGAVEQKLGLV
jgi:D-sedoheptulose 7-phosphate isomerase